MLHRKSALAFCLALVMVLASVGPSLAAGTPKININTASVDQLTTLQRIGPSYAAKIVEYREKNGPFRKIEDLMNVPGIGARTFELNKDRIAVK